MNKVLLFFFIAVTINVFAECLVFFFCIVNTKREYYQVSYLVQTDDTRKREFGALLRIKDNHPKFVLSLDDFCTGCEGIEHVNIIEWLSNGM